MTKVGGCGDTIMGQVEVAGIVRVFIMIIKLLRFLCSHGEKFVNAENL
jgi:hypothetical protein